MIVAFDASILVYFFDEEAPAPISRTSGEPVSRCRDRVTFLVDTLQRDKAKIIIPTPALGEALVKAQEGAPERLRILEGSRYFRIAPFDKRAAVEFAAMQTSRRLIGGKGSGAPRQKAKFDDQIVAISVVEGVTKIYSDDSDIKRIAGAIEVIGIEDLPLPLESDQLPLPLFSQEGVQQVESDEGE